MIRHLEAQAPKHSHAPDYVMLACAGLLTVLGIALLASASSHLGLASFSDPSFFLRRQLLQGLGIGLAGFFVCSKIFYGFWSKKYVSLGLLALTVVALLLVFTPLGLSANGATRWLAIGSFSFQPAELLKITFFIYLASWLSFKDHRQQSWRRGLLPFALILGGISSILFLQRSTSPVAMLAAIALILYFMSGAKMRYIMAIVGTGLAVVSMIVAITPYRFMRVMTYLNPEADAQGSGYHILQAKTAIGAGGLFGVGFGQSTVKYRLPETIGDSIFAVAGEEFGFIGCLFIIALFALLVGRMLRVAHRTHDPFGRLLMIAFASVIALQVFVNIGAMTGILPLTGTPLPFMSYGGTSLAIFLTMMGISANISRYTSGKAS